ncbi:hypothetical protein PAESOLCIP111_03762 [Paenibacillus solanacearum]|uniref:Peptidase S74 domain-containing protein n=1 Tax=Paenibacillus solanacearum TaxID=2048548 RepID=A0A916K4A1_9BACL|nr:glycosyl hydrolase family 28-related protein [Paenibacillus solanacearum]CAG7636567.1 hypothetical protein PAESOLCIP111_03762 [Paenibacillus solanacearum]
MNEERENREHVEPASRETEAAEGTRPDGSRMDRRAFLAGIGLAGAALAAGDLLGGSGVKGARAHDVTESVYNGDAHPGYSSPRWMHACPIDVRDFGATGDGTTDDTAAIQAALNAADGRQVCFPAGNYRITATLTVPVIRLIGEGSGRTTVIFDQMTGLDGFAFQAATAPGQEGGVERMTLLCRGAHSRHAIVTPAVGSLYYTYRTRYSFSSLEFRGNQLQSAGSGFVYDYGWETCIRLGDCWGAYIDNIDAVGTYRTDTDPLAQPDHTFLKLAAAGGILSARISGITTHGVKRGIEIGDRAFFFIAGVDIAHAYEGIVSTGTTVFSEGRIHDTLINAQRVALHLNNRSWTAISNVAVSRHKSGFDHGGDWYGMKLEQVNKSWISNIRVQADTSVTPFTGTSYGFHFTNCGGMSCDGLIAGLGLSYGIYLDNCPQHSYDGIQFQGVSGVGFSFQNNTRDCVIGTHVFSAGWTSYEYGAVDRSRISIWQKDLQLESKQPFLTMRETDGAADQKNWKWTVNGGSLNRQIQNDADGGTVNYELVTRSGMSVTQMEWRAGTLYLNGAVTRAKQMVPASDNAHSLGSMSSRWSDIYAATPTIVTSDARDKEQIRDSDLGLAFIKALRPVSYKYKDVEMTEDESERMPARRFQRPHYGLIAQEVKAALTALDAGDFAGWTEDRATSRQGLRYEEFVAPLIKAVQELSAQVSELERALAAGGHRERG